MNRASARPPLRRRPVHRLFAVALAALAAAGCAFHGPDAMRATRAAYNDAVQRSDQRELLHNLVRLRYLEAPEFLAVSSISTQMRFEAGASVGADFGDDGNADVSLLAPGAAVGYAEAPTITFVPRRDEAFTRQLVTPVELDSLYLLSRYGWGLDHALLLVADEINGLDNTIPRAGSPAATADRDALRRLAENLHALEGERQVRVRAVLREETLSTPVATGQLTPDHLLAAAAAGYRFKDGASGAPVLTGTRQHYVLSVSEAARNHPAVDGLSEQFGTPSMPLTWDIDSAGAGESAGLTLATRSVLGAMAWLSSAVDVPGDHAAFVEDLSANSLPRDMLRVRVAVTFPADAHVAIAHRGYWFYVDDRDLESKRTLGLLTSLVRLTLGAGGAQNVPVLTLPVSR